MRKLFVAALMVLSTSAAFAGDSDALKTILKAKTYAEAESLIKTSINSLASDAEKASAYNHLAQLAWEQFDKQTTAQLENQTAEQMGQKAKNVIDEELMYTSLSQAICAANESYGFDMKPNEKGKVKPRFAEKNAQKMYPVRAYLINGGGFFQGKDDAKAYQLLSQYIESAEYPLFANVKKADDPNLPNAAFFASYMALTNKDYATAEKYAGLALGDAERGADAQKIQLAAMQAQLKNHEDSVAYVGKLEDLLAKNPNDDVVLSTLCALYSNMGQGEKAEKMLDDKLAADPNNYSALMIKGQIESQKKNYDAAAENLEKALAQAPDEDTKCVLNAAVGECYFYKAQERVNNYKGVLSPAAREQFNVVYEKAIQYLEAAKKLDVMKEHKRSWAYPLYGSYYFVKGPEAAETQAAAADAGVTQ
jgi:tetratricopeptide (TPR) repeat protein